MADRYAGERYPDNQGRGRYGVSRGDDWSRQRGIRGRERDEYDEAPWGHRSDEERFGRGEDDDYPMSGQTYGGAYRDQDDWERDFGGAGSSRGGYSQGGMRGQSYGGRSYRSREDYDRDYGLSGQDQGRMNREQGWQGHGQSQGQRFGGGQGYGGGQSYGGYQSQGYGVQGMSGGYGPGDQAWSQSQRGQSGQGQQDWAQQDRQSYGQSQGGFLSRGGRQQWGRHSGRGPKGYTRSDDRIREDVCDRLSDDPHIDASEIEVKISNGEITLTGSVDSREAKRMAEDCAESVPGVRHVQNNLRVQDRNEDRTSEQTQTARRAGKNDGGGEKMQ